MARLEPIQRFKDFSIVCLMAFVFTDSLSGQSNTNGVGQLVLHLDWQLWILVGQSSFFLLLFFCPVFDALPSFKMRNVADCLAVGHTKPARSYSSVTFDTDSTSVLQHRYQQPHSYVTIQSFRVSIHFQTKQAGKRSLFFQKVMADFDIDHFRFSLIFLKRNEYGNKSFDTFQTVGGDLLWLFSV